MRARTLLVVVLAVLALSAQPVAAQNASAVASEHTSFGTAGTESSPTQLSRMTVEGSGDTANVTADGSGPTVTYNPLATETDGSVDTDFNLVGDTTNDEAQKAEIRMEPDTSGTLTSLTPIIQTTDGGDYGAVVDVYIVDEAPDNSYGEGTKVATWDPDWSTGPQSISVSDYVVNEGQTYTVEFVTRSSNGDGVGDNLGIGVNYGASKTWTTTNGDSFDYPSNLDATIESYWDQATYVSAPHDAGRVGEGWADLTLQDASATVTWEAKEDDGSWTDVASTTVTSSQNVTQGLSGTTSDSWRVRVESEATGSAPIIRIHDEGLLFDAAAPELSAPSPTGMSESYDGDISITVSDPDVGLVQGDSITVTATEADGTEIGSKTVTSNGSVAFDFNSAAGENEVTWGAIDSYGNSEIATQTFTTPSELYIRPESDPDALVSGSNVSIEVRFYTGDAVYTRTTTDGTVSLAGLPAGERFAVVLSAEGYYRRRLIIDSLFEQQTAYLLNDSTTAVEKQFVLNDVGGNFPAQSTRLYVQRSINNSTGYQTVAADYFGATSSFSTFLQTDTRYRLVIENERGDRRVLGSYTPVAAGVERLKIEGVSLYQQSQEGYIANASTRRLDSGQRQVVVRYRDAAAATSEYQVRVHERGTPENVTYTDSVSGTVENYSAYVDVENDTNYVVNWSATRGGNQIRGTVPVGGGDLGLQIPLDPQWLGTIGLVILVFIASLAGERFATHIAMTVVAFAGVLMYLAVIDLFIPGWWGALVIAIGGHIAQRRPAA